MEKYLLELIKEHNRVIVPNFGAFIISREKGQTILFNSFLSFNDGLLINQISKTDNIDIAEATVKVEEFVASANSVLDQKGIFVMDNFGTFTKDQTGILRFVQNEQEGYQKLPATEQKATNQADTIDLLDIDTTTSAPKEEAIEEPLKPSKPVPQEKLLVIDPIPPVVVPPKPAEKIDVVPPVVIPPKPIQKQEVKKPIVKPVVKPIVKKVVVEKQRNHKRGLPLWLVILFITLPIVLVILYFLFFKDGFNHFRSKTPAPIEIAAPIKVEQPVIEVQPEPIQPKPVLTTRQHHIIVGSFKDEAKANELVANLKNRGLTNASVLNQQGRFMVSADWNSSFNKALERQEELLKELNMENWVLTLK